MHFSHTTTNEESPDQRIDRPIRGVEARSEDIQYLRSSEDGANDHGDQEINDNDINPKIPEIIDDSDDVDEITPLQQLPDEPAAYKRPIRTKRAPERLMHRRHVHGQRTPPVTVYVDDLMILSDNVRTIDWLLTEPTTRYDQLKITRGMNHNYLGMVFDLSEPPFILINQQGMIEDIISSTKTSVKTATGTNFNIRSKVPPNTPATPYLFDINTDSDLLPEPLQVIFYSTVAKLIYISTRTRQDLLTTISLLSNRVLHPTQEDWNKLQRALGYFENTKTQNLKLGMTIPLTIRTYIDASFAVHSDSEATSGHAIQPY